MVDNGRNEKGHFAPGNKLGRLFAPGNNMNPTGLRCAGALIRQWVNSLLHEDEDGIPKHSIETIREIAEAPEDDPKISGAKRVAAKLILEMLHGGRRGLETISLVFDRTLGRPKVSVDLTTSPQLKRIILIDQSAQALADDTPLLPEADDSEF